MVKIERRLKMNSVGNESSIKMGLMAFILVIVASSVGLFMGSNAVKYGIQLDGLTISAIASFGIMGGLAISFFRDSEPPFYMESSKDLEDLVFWGSMGIFGIAIVQGLVGLASSTAVLGMGVSDTLNSAILYGAIGIAEEAFFRFTIFQVCLLAMRKLPSSFAVIFATVATSALFMGYHRRVYGSSFVKMSAMFLSSIVLCLVAYKTKKVGSTMFAHGAWNVLVVLVGGA